jgi:hypothetical protein
VTFTAWRVLIYPYICLFSWSVPAPTTFMLRTDAHDLKWLIDMVRKTSKAEARGGLAVDTSLFGANAKAISAEVDSLARNTRSHVAIDRKYAADLRARREEIYLNWSGLSPLADWVRSSDLADADRRPYDAFEASVTELKRRLQQPDRADSVEAARNPA